jgi:hypothetical protein
LTNNSIEGRLDQTIVQVIKEDKPLTVKQLVSLVKERLPIPEQEILETILRLQSEGKISLAKQQPPVSPKLVAYLKTEQALWYWLTMAITIATAAVVFTIPEDFYPWVYIRYVLGTIFVLWLPGYAFIKALFPTRVPIKLPTETLDTIERIALSLGMSLALVPIAGLLLNYTPWGIRLTPIVLSLLTLTIVFSTAAIIREHQNKMKANKSTVNVE